MIKESIGSEISEQDLTIAKENLIILPRVSIGISSIMSLDSSEGRCWNVPDDWFQSWFNRHYINVYSHRTTEEAEKFVNNWQIWDKVKPGQWCLDLGCGSGRYSKLIARRGIRVFAIDLSVDLLILAKSDSTNHLQTYFIRGDMRHIPSQGLFNLILSLFTSFGYFQDDNEHRRILETISSLLAPDGIFILDIPNKIPTISHVAENSVSEREIEGCTVRETRRWDNVRNVVEKKIEIIKDMRKETFFESVRLFSLNEISEMLLTAGIKLIQPPWGDYSGARLSTTSPRMIFFGATNV